MTSSQGLMRQSRLAIESALRDRRSTLSEYHGDIIRCASYFGEQLESPLEIAFVLWWTAHQDVWPILRSVLLWPQVTVAISGHSYRPDFVLVDPHTHDHLNIAVELDGHDFHERTPHQVAVRNKRDREFSRAGWFVLHFSGSEFYRDPVEVFGAVAEVIRERQSRGKSAV